MDDDRVEGSGQLTTEVRPVAAFDRVVLSGEGRVVFAAGSEGQIEIEIDDNLLDLIEADVSGGTLTIGTESGVDIDPSDGVTYRLGCPEITSAALTGAGEIDLSTCTTGERLHLELAGAGTINAPDIDVALVRAMLPGAGTIRVHGLTDRVEVELTGAGVFEGAELRAVTGAVESSGVGTTTVWVTEMLDLRLSGVGDIRYFGEPTLGTAVTGVGAIEALGPK